MTRTKTSLESRLAKLVGLAGQARLVGLAGLVTLAGLVSEPAVAQQASAYTAYESLYEQATTAYSQSGHHQTPAPTGYTPYWVSTYMRHGSRWLINSDQYDRPIRQLATADSLHLLTKIGQQLLRDLLIIREASPDDKLGVLTPRGYAQHDSIATRMWRNFPEVFDRTAQISARSSAVPRCVKSMAEEVETLQRLTRNFYIKQESGIPQIQHRLAPSDPHGALRDAIRQAEHKADSINHAYQAQHVPTERIQQSWFRNSYELSQHDLQRLILDIYDLASNEQSLQGILDSQRADLPDLFHYFTEDEVYALWQCKNVAWYMHANAPQTQGLGPLKKPSLLEDLREDADSVARLGEASGMPGQEDYHGATMRFGHDGCLLPLLCLMQVEGVSRQVADLDTLDRVWRDYEIVPMAGNLQMVFYHCTDPQINGNIGVLIKILLNEREVHLPLNAVNDVYYQWRDVIQLWSHLGLNQGPAGYESAALTN